MPETIEIKNLLRMLVDMENNAPMQPEVAVGYVTALRDLRDSLMEPEESNQDQFRFDDMGNYHDTEN